MSVDWRLCSRGHRCCEDLSPHHDHFLNADDCPGCASLLDPLVESVQDECPTCGAYMLNPTLHANWHPSHPKSDPTACGVCGSIVGAELMLLHMKWHGDIAKRADSYKHPPTYGGYR